MVTQLAYSQLREFTVMLGGQLVHVVTKPGFARWDQITPASVLLAEVSKIKHKPGDSPKDILVLGSGHGALGVALAKNPDVRQIWVADTTLTALSMAERTLRKNEIYNAYILTDPQELDILEERFDAIFIELPKGRRLIRRWLVEARRALKPAGILYLAGANGEGIQPAIKDAHALFGNATILGYKKGNRIARMIKDPAHLLQPDWVNEPGIQPGTWIEFSCKLGDSSLHIRSLPGVFSMDQLDPGTAFLLTHLTLPIGARVLDVGCGYGVIGLFAWHSGASRVDMVDNHLLSIACARENIRRNCSTPSRPETVVQAFTADVLEFIPGYGYTHILTNPPFHAGKAVEMISAHAFISQAHRLLAPGGQLILVSNRFIRYDRLMESLFGNISRIAESSRFHILASNKNE